MDFHSLRYRSEKQPEMKGQGLSLDKITTLPQAITDTILSLLPIKEAARTSILSREWRYKWTTIPKLEFYLSMVCKTKKWSDLEKNSHLAMGRRNMDIVCKLFYVINQVMLQRQAPKLGAIRVTGLSRNHAVNKLSLELYHSDSYNLPLSVFSLHHLTELNLTSCGIIHRPILNRLGSLTCLTLDAVRISTETLLHLLSNCPSLKSLRLLLLEMDFCGDRYPNITKLFKCLPVIEHLTTWGHIIPLLFQDSVPQELPTLLIHLKYLCIYELVFGDGYGLTFLGVLIKCSPNIEKIKLETFSDDGCDKIVLDKLKEYSDVWLEHLNELEIKFSENFMPELEFVKFILARSPNLNKVILRIFMDDKNRELEMTKILLRAPRTSSVEIIVDNCF